MNKSRQSKNAGIVLLIFFGTCIGFGGCSNSLTDYLFKNLFYEGWKIASWSSPQPVVDTETHELGNEKRNGFPMNMAMGSNGKIHLVGFRVSTREWVYAVRNPGSDRFEQEPFTVIADLGSVNPDEMGLMPGIELFSDDVPIIAYGAGGVLYFHMYDAVDGWKSQEQLFDASTELGADDITNVFCTFSADFKIHLFFKAGNSFYHTIRTGYATVDPPQEILSDVGTACVLHLGSGGMSLLYTDSAKKNLYYAKYGSDESARLYSVPSGGTLGIGGINALRDSQGTVHAVFGVYDTETPTDPSSNAIGYFRNREDLWVQEKWIEGTSSYGPLAAFTSPALDVAEDSNGNLRVHLAYTRVTSPLGFFIHYAYYDEVDGWQISDKSVDTTYTNSFWTFPLLAVGPQGEVHLVYSWTQSELDRTMVYVRGIPREMQE
ncbi:MAG: hypothetical protein K9L66_11600 [Spirochaetaceae bacterium]|nr:hypothetical protein [Spirochaetaceae bacterium]MCF7939759.1 hypothetical protein [Spirochaetales bacterium]